MDRLYVSRMNRKITRDYTHGAVLAPMAGSTDSAFRRICRRLGATAVVTEMVAAAGLSRRSVKTHKLLRFSEEEKPIGIQLFGRNPGDFHDAAALVSDLGFDFIDINAGCPVKKVVGSGSGSALLKDVPLLAAIVRAAVSGTGLPVTVKIRLGWSSEDPVDPSLPDVLAGEGASAIAVHGRFRSDMFSGAVRSEGIRDIVRSSPLPVIANGASESVQQARDLLKTTGASGLMIGRGALGNPWIFRGLAEDPESGVPGRGELHDVVMEQLRMMMEYIPEEHVFNILRGHLLNYLKGFRGASSVRRRAVRVSCEEELEELLMQAEEMMSMERSRVVQ